MPSTNSNRRSHLDLIQQARAQSDEGDRRLAADGSGLSQPSAPLRGDAFPGYVLEKEIHRGGQGTVYRAMQQSTGRRVAIKLMHDSAFGGPLERARFERETRVLAALHHPNIVAIHDAGSHDGRFFLVMDYIAGRPLDAFVAGSSRSVRETLELFVQICDAVNAAHLGGIIHRDLKPANVRVNDDDRPIVLDFGLAKFTMADGAGAESAADAGMTLTGQFLGSLPWAAPEQADGSPTRIDLRTDVYALGVTLYQLLTGKFPYRVTGDVRSVLDNIVRAEPVPPRSVCREIDDELETIILKCLSKERERRYQTAGELARDLRRYLNGELIEAKRDSRWYLVRRTLLRHKIAAAVAAGYFLLVSGSAIALLKMYREKAAEYARAEDQRLEAVEARDRAEKAAQKADAVTEFLRTMLSSADPEHGQGHMVKVVDVLRRASGQAAEQFSNQPEVEVAIRLALGESYYGLGQYPEAEAELGAGLKLAQQKLGQDHSDTLGLTSTLGATFWIQGKLREAEPLMRAGLETELRLRGEDQIGSIIMMDNLAAVLKRTGRAEEALQLNRRAFAAAERALGPDHETTRICLGNLAFGLEVTGNYAEAESMYRRALEIDAAAGRGADHPIAASSRVAFANVLVTLGKLEEAESLARESLEFRRQHLPPGHLLTGDSFQMLGRVMMAGGNASEAEKHFREALEIQQAALPAGSWRIAVTQSDLGFALTRLERFADAEPLLQAAHATLDQTAGNQPRHELSAVQRLAEMYEGWDRAEPGKGYAEKGQNWREKLEAMRATSQPAVSTKPVESD